MRLLSPILQRVVYPVLGSAGYFHSRASSRVSVVTYHGVLPVEYQSADPFLDNTLVSVASFRSQLKLLKKYYNVISPDRFLRWLRNEEDLPTRAVLLTCDDGLLNNLTTMLPILLEEECKCLFFVTGGSLGDASQMLWYVELYLMLMQASGSHPQMDWRGTPISLIPDEPRERRVPWLQLLKSLSRVDADERRTFLGEATGDWGLDPAWQRRYLDDPALRERFQLLLTPELKQLADAGMTIGAHTLSHPILMEQPVDLARSEIANCKKAVETALGKPVWALAYPFGEPHSVGDREYRLAEAAGYECAFVNVGGTLGTTPCRFSLPRIHVTREMSLPVYEAYISGFHDGLKRMFRCGSSNRPQSTTDEIDT
jgi:peptidoglycan/xylan/chitin deacetylase (PgdA/CDA1 family)